MGAKVALIVMLVGLAAWPGVYIWRYLASAPQRREEVLTAEAYVWRRPGKARLCAIVLALLAAATCWIATLGAEDPRHLPLLVATIAAAGAVWLFAHAFAGMGDGRIELFLLHHFRSVERDGHPLIFWIETGAALLLGAVALAVAGTQLLQVLSIQ